jgi:DNA-binding HxlR family transcriptional regulator
MDQDFVNVDDCPVKYTLSVIGGKWKPIIVYHLSTAGVMRYGEIRKSMPKITHKMLSTQLKELEADGLILRTEYPQVPPKVEYQLKEKGISLMPVFTAMGAWGTANR